MQEHTKFICCIRQALGSLLPSAAGSALLEGSGGRKSKEWEKLPQVLLRLRANKPASPPRSRRKKQFIVTNGESLQPGWPFLSKLVNHTRRGEGLAVKWDMHHSRGGKPSGEPGRKRSLPAWGAGEHCVSQPATTAGPPLPPLSVSCSSGIILGPSASKRGGRFGQKCLGWDTGLGSIQSCSTSGMFVFSSRGHKCISC